MKNLLTVLAIAIIIGLIFVATCSKIAVKQQFAVSSKIDAKVEQVANIDSVVAKQKIETVKQGQFKVTVVTNKPTHIEQIDSNMIAISSEARIDNVVFKQDTPAIGSIITNIGNEVIFKKRTYSIDTLGSKITISIQGNKVNLDSLVIDNDIVITKSDTKSDTLITNSVQTTIVTSNTSKLLEQSLVYKYSTPAQVKRKTKWWTYVVAAIVASLLTLSIK